MRRSRRRRCRSRFDLHRLGERPDPLRDVGHVAVDERLVRHSPRPLREAAGRDDVAQVQDTLAVQRAGTDAALEAVVLGRIVRARDLDAGDHRQVMEAPIQERRRHLADVDHVEPTGVEPAHQRVAQRPAARPVVAPHRDRTGKPTLGQDDGVPATDRLCGLGREVLAVNAADVVLAEDAGSDHSSLPVAVGPRARTIVSVEGGCCRAGAGTRRGGTHSPWSVRRDAMGRARVRG